MPLAETKNSKALKAEHLFSHKGGKWQLASSANI
jgi:hypothetical protein